MTSKPRILLISSPHLFGESMEMLLRAEKEVELIGPWDLEGLNLCERAIEERPSVIVIADENARNEYAAQLTKSIMERCLEISVIYAALNENIFRLFSTRTLPARGEDLLEAIHACARST
ncbi:MAG: hypothetical protein KJZ52_06295 [Anaerolineales bacterium]|nr:hypothetical protein [Anaerolineales bacterium]